MSDVVYLSKSSLVNIADAIRAKTGSTRKMKVADMPSKINGILTSGSIPAEGLNISGKMTNRFMYNYWNWYLEDYKEQISITNVTDASGMFTQSNELRELDLTNPICIDENCSNFSYMFQNCSKLQKLPTFLPPAKCAFYWQFDLTNIFYQCYNLRNIQDGFFTQILSKEAIERLHLKYNSLNGIFTDCYSLRKLPDVSMLYDVQNSEYSTFYYQGLYGCYTLDEATNLPVPRGELTGNIFQETFNDCSRIKDITFSDFDETVNWSNQTIFLTDYVGYTNNKHYITGYNSGIAESDQVTDIDSYNEKKDSENWWSSRVEFSRYNADSARRTLASLPTTSGSGCTIMFDGESGSSTDGGAIKDLTESDIAVAAAKGWTVSIK